MMRFTFAWSGKRMAWLTLQRGDEDPLVPVEEGIVEAAGVFAAATEAAA